MHQQTVARHYDVQSEVVTGEKEGIRTVADTFFDLLPFYR